MIENRTMLHQVLVNLLIAVALLLLVTGIFAPLMTLEKFYFFENVVSLYSALVDLRLRQEWLLFAAILIFSVIMPVAKILILFLVWNVRHTIKLQRYMHWMMLYGKWSMLDVFVVALLLVTVKLDLIADVKIHYGIYVFSASVLLTMLLTFWINRIQESGKVSDTD